MADSSSEQPSLTVVGGPLVGQRLVLDDAVANLLIGSDPSCDLYLPHDSVSPIHARLWMDLEGAVLHETSSPHGVYVNDVRVAGKHPLHNGDIVWLGPPGGADVVMIQCTLAGNEDEANTAPAPPDDTAERDALESLAPTLAARPSLADFDDAPGAGPEAEPPPIPRSRPAARTPEAAEPDSDDTSRTVAFRLPADFAAALAVPRAQEPAAAPAPTPPDDLDALFAEHQSPPMDVTVAEPPAYVPEPPPAALAEGEPYLAEPEPYLAEPEPYVAEPEPYVATPAEPEPASVEPDPTQVMFAEPEPPPAPAPVPPAGADADFDDMIFAVPEEAPPAPPEPETVLVAPPPPPQPPAPPAPSPRAPEPPKTQPAAAAAAQAPVARASQATAPAPPRPETRKPPAPRPAAPAAVRPRPAARVERAPAEAIEVPAPSRKLPVAALAGAGVLVVVLAAAAGAFWYLNRAEPAESAGVIPPPPPIETTPAVTPMTTLEAQPTPDPAPTAEALPTVAPGEDVVTIVRTATPPPRAVPSAAPTAAATPRPVATRRPDPVDPAAQVSGLLAQAQTSAAARNYDAAAVLYDEALRLDPQNAAALSGKAAAASARAHGRRAFVTGRTAVQTEKARGGGLAGFDSSDVKVQKAPDFQGRVEFVMTPSSVQPGDPWTLKVYVVNEGKKAIKISALSVATVVNGNRSGTGGAPKNREIAPQQRVIVDELSGTWPAGVASWSTDVKVTAGKNDTLQSQLIWK